jgi:hypothetical protein
VQDTSGIIGRIQSTSGDAQFNIAVPNANDGILAFGDAANYRASIKVNTSDAITFQTSSSLTERMRIDSSGNLLVGKTSASTGSVGGEFRPDGLGVFGRSADYPLILNRTTSDGGILLFRKDGTNVGEIGALSSRLTIGRGGVGLFFDNVSSDAIEPHSMSTNSVRTDAINIGAVGSRFKDLYLSGGVYLGGTGSANKLDDYEEGTWTPTYVPVSGSFTSITYRSSTAGTYTKVGRMVTLVATLDLDALSFGSGSGNLQIGGNPFTELDSTSSYSGGVSQQFGWTTAPTQAFLKDDGYIGLGYMPSSGGGGYDVIDVSDMNSGGRNRMRFTLTYFTT